MSRKSLARCLGGVILAQIVAIGGGIWPMVMVAGGLGALFAIIYLIAGAVKEPEEPASKIPFDTTEALDHWRARTEVLVSWADGTALEWDRHIRPIIGREVQTALGGRVTSERGEFAFGPWWAWVDPKAHGTGQNSPGREGLDEILKRLELITTGEATA